MPPQMNSSLVVLHALTFLHPGTGQTTGVVDLPVQREVHTGFPMVASSGVKGCLRSKAEEVWGRSAPLVNTIFGSDDAQTAGCLAVTDARILAFPVRSLQKVFVWVTCPMVLERAARDAGLAGLGAVSGAKVKVDEGHVLTSAAARFTSPLVLEELALEVTDQLPAAAGLGSLVPEDIKDDVEDRLVVVRDAEFQYLVMHATQISARIKLNDETKTTSGNGGNLWYEETLPPETLMYVLLFANQTRNGAAAKLTNAADVMSKITELLGTRYLQVGGNETVGQGWCRVRMFGGTR